MKIQRFQMTKPDGEALMNCVKTPMQMYSVSKEAANDPNLDTLR